MISYNKTLCNTSGYFLFLYSHSSLLDSRQNVLLFYPELEDELEDLKDLGSEKKVTFTDQQTDTGKDSPKSGKKCKGRNPHWFLVFIKLFSFTLIVGFMVYPLCYFNLLIFNQFLIYLTCLN